MEEKKDSPLFFTIGKMRERILNHQRRSEEKTENLHRSLKSIQDAIDNNIKMIENPEAHIPADTPPFMVNLIKENGIPNSTATANEGQTQDDAKIKASTSSSSEKDKAEQKEPVKLLDKKKIRGLKDNLSQRVFGQDPVLEEVVDILKIAALNIKINKQKPAGNYLFAGPSGVGKTELAQSLADSLGVPILIVNMGEYGLEQDVTKLIGTSPGYVGYQEGGILTNFVKENPACIVLFDELEKAHPSADKILLSIMDKGTCTDNKGVEVSFKETIVISTSNLGADIEYVQGIDQETKNKYRMDAIKEGLRPEIINRYDSVFHFYSLSPEIYRKVADKFLIKLNDSMKEEHKINLKFTDKLMDFIVEKSFDPAMGGRPARRFIEKIVIKPLADYMLDENFEKAVQDHPEISLDINKDGNVCFKGKNRKVLGVLENTKELVARIEEGKFTNKKPSTRP